MLEPRCRLAPAPAQKRVPGQRFDAAAHQQHRNINVGPPLALDRQLDHRLEAAQREHPRLDDAAGLDRNQRGRFAERRSHLEARGLARRVAALLGNHVDAILVARREPQVAGTGDPIAGSGLRDVALAVAGLRQQIDVARRAGRQRASDLAARIAAPLADLAEIGKLGVILVSVKTADDALAVAVVDAPLGADFDRCIGDRLALRVEYDDLDLAARRILTLLLVADRNPVLDADTGDDRRRSDVDRAVQRLDLAIRVGESHLRVDLARPADRLRQRHDELAGAGRVERQRLLVEQQSLVLTPVVDGKSASPRLVEIDEETEIVVALVLRPARAQRRRHRDLGALGGAAVEKGERQRQGNFARRDDRSGRTLDAAGKDRQAEVGNGEAAAADADTVAGAGQLDLIAAAPGRGRDLPGAERHALTIPDQRLAEFVAAAVVADDHFARQRLRVGKSETAAAAFARDVLHRHRLPGAQQRSVEDRVDLARVDLAPGVDAETPGLDALVPVRANEAVVVTQASAGEEEVVILTALFGQRDRRQRAPLIVAAPGPQRPAVASGKAHVGTGDRLAAIERGDPDERVVAPALEMHRHIGDQRRAAHVHRLGASQQRGAEQTALDLDDMKTGVPQRDADHLERRAAAGLGQLAAGHAGLALEERQFARVVRVVIIVRIAALTDAVTLGLLLEFGERADRGDHLAVVGQPLAAQATCALRRQLQAGHRQQRLDVAQRHRQHAALLELDDAECAGELGERRRAAGAQLEREARGIVERAAGLVLDSRRQFERQFGVGRQRPLEDQRAGGVGAAAVRLGRLRRTRALRREQTRASELLDVDRHREVDAQIGERRTRRSGLLALAADAGAKRLTNAELKALAAARPAAVLRLDAGPPDQTHAGAGRQSFGAGQRHSGRRRLALQRGEDFVARRRRQQAHRNSVADAVGLAPDVALDRLALERSGGIDDEDLIFLNRRACARCQRTRPRPRREESVGRLALDRFATDALELALEPEVATLARPQSALQRERPAPGVAPATATFDAAAIDDEWRSRIGLTERDHVGGKNRAGAQRLIDRPLRRELADAGGIGDTRDGKRGEQSDSEGKARNGHGGP